MRMKFKELIDLENENIISGQFFSPQWSIIFCYSNRKEKLLTKQYIVISSFLK